MIIFDYENLEYKGFLTPFTAIYMGASKNDVKNLDVMIYDFYSNSIILKDVPIENLLSMFDILKKTVVDKQSFDVIIDINTEVDCNVRYHKDDYVTLGFARERFDFYDENFDELKRDIENAVDWLKQFLNKQNIQISKQ